MDPAWEWEVLTQDVPPGHAEHGQGADRGREARAGDHHPGLPVLAGNGQQAREASGAARRLADQAYPAGGHSSDDDPERHHPRQEPEGRTGGAEGRPYPDPATQGASSLGQQECLEPLDLPHGVLGMELDEEEPRTQAHDPARADSPGNGQGQQASRQAGAAVPYGSQGRHQAPLGPAPRPPTPEPREDIAHHQGCPFLGNRDPLQVQQEAEQQDQCREYLEAELQADLAGVDRHQDEQEDIIQEMCRLDRMDREGPQGAWYRGGRYDEYCMRELEEDERRIDQWTTDLRVRESAAAAAPSSATGSTPAGRSSRATSSERAVDAGARSAKSTTQLKREMR